MMKIKLLKNVPVDKIHGMIEGRILEVTKEERGAYWVMGEGEEVKIWDYECEVIK